MAPRAKKYPTEVVEFIPLGWCGCGCGHRTVVCGQTNASVGHVKGEFNRYLAGHNSGSRPYFVPDENGCWIWQGTLNEHGYGRVHADGVRWYVHRLEYVKAYGEIPEGLILDHLCSTPACCNPDHLETVPQRENVRRGRVARLTAADARAIRDAQGFRHANDLARAYGVVGRTIHQIWSGETWAHA